MVVFSAPNEKAVKTGISQTKDPVKIVKFKNVPP